MALNLPHNPLDNLVPGRVQVGNRSVSKNTIALVSISLFVIAGLLVFLYFKNKKFHDLVQNLLRLGSVTQAVDVADAVQFETLPNEVRPNSQFTIVGSFYDKNGKPQTVKNAYYFVYLDQNLLVQGSIGQNVSAFQTVVPTTGFINGKNYTVRVADQPFLSPPLTNPNIPETRYLPIPGTTTTGSNA